VHLGVRYLHEPIRWFVQMVQGWQELFCPAHVSQDSS
jgi:hypothetical protein